MKYTAYIFTFGLTLALSMIGPISGSSTQDAIQEATHLDCSQCHDCQEPTPEDPCLKACPTHSMTRQTASHGLTEAPDRLLLDKLAEQYKPVSFNHKLHAEMAEMGSDCATCHHYSPPGQIPPCAECHDSETNSTNLRQPSLKGAYHRQCLSCHREWSHDTKCVVCHLPADLASASAQDYDTTDIIGVPHPVIQEPTKKVYRTPYEQAPIVTFYHEEHIHLFDLTCANCHKQENCSYCHDLQRESRTSKTQEEIHAMCDGCHETDNCAKCHDTKQRPGFTHSASAWTKTEYHQDLPCRGCHPTGKKIGHIDGNCASCHAGWNPDNFNHAVTGFQLDEYHVEFDCEYCHTNLAFTETPDCSNCHDDERTHEDAPPGYEIEPLQAHSN